METIKKFTKNQADLMNLPDILPDKLSDLLELAVRDALKVSKLKKFVLVMSDWFEARPNKQCGVCLAGSVMAGTLKCRVGGDGAYPSNFNESIHEKLEALNALRCGNWSYSLPARFREQVETNIKAQAAMKLIERDYGARDGGRAQWSTYRKAAVMLRAAGL